MKILIVGGTRFQGREFIRQLLAARVNVTIFNRGNFPIKDIFPKVTSILGNRNDPQYLKLLSNGRYDWCIDTCAYYPEQIEILREHVNASYYCLISTVFAYKDSQSQELIREDHKLEDVSLAGLSLNKISYPWFKAACERAAKKNFGSNTLILRPSIIIGENDHTERLKLWLRLIVVHHMKPSIRGLNPSFQPLDVVDVASFLKKILESNRTGAVNVCGNAITFDKLLDIADSISGGKSSKFFMDRTEYRSPAFNNLPLLEDCDNRLYATDLAEQWGFHKTPLKNTLARLINNKEYIYSDLTRLCEFERRLTQVFTLKQDNH